MFGKNLHFKKGVLHCTGDFLLLLVFCKTPQGLAKKNGWQRRKTRSGFIKHLTSRSKAGVQLASLETNLATCVIVRVLAAYSEAVWKSCEWPKVKFFLSPGHTHTGSRLQNGHSSEEASGGRGQECRVKEPAPSSWPVVRLGHS